ncbi:MAG: HAD-IA family hydrolase [Paracoccaceae bacterium]
MTIKAVVFDIGNVLIHWDPKPFYDNLIGPERRKQLFEQAGLDEMNELVDLGHPFRQTIYDWADKHPEWRNEIRMWHDHWIEFARPEIPLSVHLMKALQAKGIAVNSLSNFGVDSYDYAATFYPFLREFDQDFVSGHMRVIKPDPEIYAMLEAKTKLSGAELIFTDDRADNILAASERGWKTHLFTGPEGWAARLVEEGLLTEEEAQP